MNDLGTYPEARAVRFERLLPGPIERVWSYLVESDKRAEWFASGPMELKPDGKAVFTWRHSDYSPTKEPIPERFKQKANGQTMEMKVMRVEAPRLLVLRWGEHPTDPSEATFELTPEGDKVRLVLTHRRLTSRDSLHSVSGGWHTHLRVLDDVLNGRTPAPFWSEHLRHLAIYEPLVPAE